MSYEEIYPQGEGRKIVERTCIGCHGPNYLPSHQWNADQWNSAINLMTEGGSPAIPAECLPPDRREILVKYLVDNFGPKSEFRSLAQAGMPLDESKLSKAEYIEFYMPLDPPGIYNNDPNMRTCRASPSATGAWARTCFSTTATRRHRPRNSPAARTRQSPDR